MACASLRPETATGLATPLGGLRPWPSWPSSLAPQQRTSPVPSSAQPWPSISTSSAPLTLEISLGVLTWLGFVVPAWPWKDQPQQYTWPLLSATQVVALPTETSRAFVSAGTSIGVSALALELLPKRLPSP